MDPGTAMLLSSAIGAGASYLGRKKQTAQGPQVVTMPQYSFTEPRLRLTSDFISDNLRRLQAGKYPAYYESALPTIRKGMKRGLRESFYGGAGLEGGQGIIGEARAIGAATGIGPKATVAQVNKALSTYATKEQEIDEYLTKIGVDFSAQTQGQVLAASGQLPKGPDATVIPGMSAPSEPNYAMDAVGTLAKAAPYFFGQGTPTTAGTTPGVPGADLMEGYSGGGYGGGGNLTFSGTSSPGGYSSAIHPTNLSEYYLQ